MIDLIILDLLDYTTAVLALWIITHTITELPWPATFGKPFTCQLCLSGWISIACAIVVSLLYADFYYILTVLSIWALSVFTEAVYQRLQTVIL